MANEIKELYGANTALTITLASLASSTTLAGRQSTIVDNTTARYRDILLYVKVKLGASPSGDLSVKVFLLRDDDQGTDHRSDGAGDSDADITILNAPLLGVMITGSTPSTGDDLFGEFLIHRPGPAWGIAVSHDTGVALNSTGSNHWARYIGINPEIQ